LSDGGAGEEKKKGTKEKKGKKETMERQRKRKNDTIDFW
jgi:hypothetical protein